MDYSFELILAVLVVIAMLANIIQSFFVYRSVNADRANELFLAALTAAQQTPSDLDDRLIIELKRIFDALATIPAQTANNDGCGAEGSASELAEQKKHWEQD